MIGKTGNTNIPTRQLSARLEEQILSGEISGKLPSERRMAESFGVSRPVVRETLRTLAERNLVEISPGRGAYVRAASLSDAARPLKQLLRRGRATPRDLVEARKMIECESALLAATRAEEGDLHSMEAALHGFETQAGLLEQARCDVSFHMSIIRAARNPVIETMYSSITSMTVELMLRSLADPAVAHLALPYHRRIYEAIRSRDPDRARLEMADHLAVAEKRYGEDLNRTLDSLALRELERMLGPGASLEEFIEAAVPKGLKPTDI